METESLQMKNPACQRNQGSEHNLRKQRAQRRMATWTLIGMGAFTVVMFVLPLDRIAALADISNLFYISGAGIVGAYMGTTAYMSKK